MNHGGAWCLLNKMETRGYLVKHLMIRIGSPGKAFEFLLSSCSSLFYSFCPSLPEPLLLLSSSPFSVILLYSTFIVYTAYILLFLFYSLLLLSRFLSADRILHLIFYTLWKYFRDDRDQLTTFPFLLFSYILDLSPPLRLGS